MATLNPLEQKARTSFLKGFIIALIIGIVAAAFLGSQLWKKIDDEKRTKDALKQVVILNTNVSAGQLVTEDMFTTMKVDPTLATASQTKEVAQLQSYYLTDKNGNKIDMVENGEQKTYQIKIAADAEQPNGGVYDLTQSPDKDSTFYYKTSSGDVQYVELADTALIAKIDLTKNTILTEDMLGLNNEKTTDDLREQEYNMVTVPTDLKNNDVIDIRLRVPSGEDLIVESKKRVRLLDGGDNPSVYANTIIIQQTEQEILTMSAAIVDAYRMKGCKFYATKYTDPGLQKESTLTYMPSAEVQSLISKDPNIVATAQAALTQTYLNDRANNNEKRQIIYNSINKETEDAQKSLVESGTSTEISDQQSERKQYLQGLADSESAQ